VFKLWYVKPTANKEKMMKIGRNAPCPCGSGKKYKKCGLNKDQQVNRENLNEYGHLQHQNKGFIQKKGRSYGDLKIRPYVLAKMCASPQKHVQNILEHYPDSTKSSNFPSRIRSLSTEQIIKELSERGIQYNPVLFKEKCEENESAWDVAERLWFEQAKSLSANVSDFVGIAACILWERLYDEKKLTKISYEMLDDWMEEGYKYFENDHAKACKNWLKAWEAFKVLFELPKMSIKQIDNIFNGSQSFFNWCQDLEMELLNASIVDKKNADVGVAYLDEFLNYFSDEDDLLIKNFRTSLGELYCRAGKQEMGEKKMRELIDQYPNEVCGYIGMEMALSVRELNGLTPAHKERLQILEEAKNYPVIDGDGYSLNARIDDLKAQIKGLG